jgi:hypothetical protein
MTTSSGDAPSSDKLCTCRLTNLLSAIADQLETESQELPGPWGAELTLARRKVQEAAFWLMMAEVARDKAAPVEEAAPRGAGSHLN